jgi:hypothetical protein
LLKKPTLLLEVLQHLCSSWTVTTRPPQNRNADLAMKGVVKRYRFKLVDCAAIVDELGTVDWCNLFSGRGVDQCVDIFYETI